MKPKGQVTGKKILHAPEQEMPHFHPDFTAWLSAEHMPKIAPYRAKLEALGCTFVMNDLEEPPQLELTFNKEGAPFDMEKFEAFLNMLSQAVPLAELQDVYFTFSEEVQMKKPSPKQFEHLVDILFPNSGMKLQVSTNGEPVFWFNQQLPNSVDISLRVERNENKRAEKPYDVIGEVHFSGYNKETQEKVSPTLSMETLLGMGRLISAIGKKTQENLSLGNGKDKNQWQLGA